MWDPMGSWMAAVQIPFQDLGGPPKDGDVWGFQAAIRYADPKITAVLSPGDDFAAPRPLCPRAVRCAAAGQLPLPLAERGGDQAGDLLRRRHLQQRRQRAGMVRRARDALPGRPAVGQRNLCPRGQAALQVRRRHGTLPLPLAAGGRPPSATRSPALSWSTARQSAPCTTSTCRTGGWRPASAIG